MRLFRSLGLTTLGAFAGLTAAAALMKRVLRSRGDSKSDGVAPVAIFDGIEAPRLVLNGFALFGGVAVGAKAGASAPAS